VRVAGPAGEEDGLAGSRLRRESNELAEPHAHRFGRHVFVPDIAPSDLPPLTDPAHGRHHHLIDRPTEAELADGVVQAHPDPSRVHGFCGGEKSVDEVAGRFGGFQQEPRADCRIGGPLAAGDLIAHEPQLIHRSGRVAAVAAHRSRRRRNVITALPGSQGGDRHRQQPARLLDGQRVTSGGTCRPAIVDGQHGFIRCRAGPKCSSPHRAEAAAWRQALRPTVLHRFGPCSAK
jgi:hypothetical protein